MTSTLRNFIDGEYTKARSGRTAPVIDPATGEAYTEAPVSGAEDVDLAMCAASAAFPGWRDSTPRSAAWPCSASPTPSRPGPTRSSPPKHQRLTMLVMYASLYIANSLQ